MQGQTKSRGGGLNKVKCLVSVLVLVLGSSRHCCDEILSTSRGDGGESIILGRMDLDSG